MRRRKKNYAVTRITIITLAVFLIISADVFFVSIAKVHPSSGTDLAAYAEDADIVTQTMKALRGNIYDRKGNVIAEDDRTYNIYCILDSSRPSAGDKPAYVKDKEGTADALAPILNMDKEKILGYLNQEDVYQTELGNEGRQLSQDVRDQILALDLPGIGFTDSIQRTYPYGQFASNLIGYAQADENGSEVGKMGIEQILNDYLTGTDGKRTVQVNKDGYVLPGMQEETVSEENGANVYLTIDSSIQQQLETSMKQTVEGGNNVHGVWGGAMEIKTGKVIAWGQSDSFDPNSLEITQFNNIGTQIPYEPGSTMKPFTWAAAINEGKYDGDAKVDGNSFCYTGDANNNPVRSAGGACVYNAEGREWGQVTYDFGLIMSLNSVAASVENEVIDPDTDLQYIRNFGFFKDVDTDGLPEDPGVLGFTWPGDKVALTYGQGSTVTMLQMFQGYSAIFGNGNTVKPYFIESIRDPYDNSNVIYQASTKVTGTPITAESARHVQSILYRVVNDDVSTGGMYKIPETSVIGKTGTAEVAVDGRYDSTRYISSFMCAMPADDPQVLVYYAVDQDGFLLNSYEPQKAFMRAIAMAYGLTNGGTPKEEESQQPAQEIVTSQMPALTNHSLDYAHARLDSLGTDIQILGGGSTVIDQYPKAGQSVETGQRTFLLTDSQGFTMPDLSGWTRKDVTALWEVSGFQFKLEGSGKVTSQSIPAGSTVTKGTGIDVVFS